MLDINRIIFALMNKNALHISIYIPSDFKRPHFILQTFTFMNTLQVWLLISHNNTTNPDMIIIWWKDQLSQKNPTKLAGLSCAELSLSGLD